MRMCEHPHAHIHAGTANLLVLSLLKMNVEAAVNTVYSAAGEALGEA